jgi:hypothetical protein
MNFKLIKYLIFAFIAFILTGLNGQIQIYEKQTQPFAFNTNLCSLVSYKSEKSIHIGLSKSNLIVGLLGIELDYYNNKSRKKYNPYNQILDINLVCKRKLPRFTGKQFYVTGGTFLRYTYLVGLPGKNFTEAPQIIYSYNEKSIHKIGLGTSLGVGLNIYKNIFFENSIKFGRYFIGKNDQLYGQLFSGISDQDATYFFSIDIFKFGCKFGSLTTVVDTQEKNNSKFGVSVNMYRLLKSILKPDSDSGISYSLSLSYYFTKQNLEFEVPLYFKNFEKSVLMLEENDVEPGLREVNHIGVCMKKYFYGFEFGTYLSGFVRYCHLRGELDTDNFSSNDLVERSEDKLAIGLGAGYKYFLNGKWYLDFYLQVGKYMIGENDVFPSSDFDDFNDNDYIHDIGSLKIGYRFNI